MKKSIHLFGLFLLVNFLLFFILIAVSSGASVPVNNIKEMLTEQLKESSDTDEILKGLQNVEGLVYRSGNKSKGVRELQNLLLSCGYAIGKADGAYGVKTASAVREFQSANNLSVTGEADLITQFSLVTNNSSFTRKGNTYIAQVKNYAVIIWPGKAFYVGTLDKSGNFSEGTYYYFSNYFGGGYYTGEYKNNKRSGKGTAHFANGDVYTGEWENDIINGYGTYYFDGTKIAGRWSNNRFVK